jgi:sRNA-binding carbon storage regulator CsrA
MHPSLKTRVVHKHGADGIGSGRLKLRLENGQAISIGDDIKVTLSLDLGKAHLIIEAPRTLRVCRLGDEESDENIENTSADGAALKAS